MTIFWTKPRLPGRVGITSRPRGGDWLNDEVRTWKAAGVDIVVSLLEAGEAHELDLDAEEAVSRKQGIGLRFFPIPDRGLPPSRTAALDLADDLARAAREGKSIVVHCRQGIGRSAIIAASVLVADGEQPDRALAAVEKARGCPIPDTPEQRAWVAGLPARGSSR